MQERGPNDPTVATGSGPVVPDDDEAFCPACEQSYPVELDVCPADGARLAKLTARPDPLLGRVFDNRYEVKTRLGQGGMGTVYRGHQRSVDREVAIKVIHPKIASDRTAVKRFLREARLSSRLSQPSIVNVYDFGQTEDGILFIVMELLRGHTLAEELREGQGMPPRRVINIAVQLCDALASAHGHGIIHRDLKPGNIVILDDPPGRDLIKVLDFGLAKSLVAEPMGGGSLVTNTSAIMGTPLYMCPEQIEGRATDQRADLYALGCILYHMVAGRPPFDRENVSGTLSAHLYDPLPPLPTGVPAVLAQTIDQLVQKDPQARPATASVVRELLGAPLHESAPPARPGSPSTVDAVAKTEPSLRAATPTPDEEPLARSRRWLAPIVVLALAGLGVGLYAVTRPRSQPVAASVPTDPDAVDGGAQQAAAVDAGSRVDASAPPSPDAGKPVPRDAGARARPDAASILRPDAAVVVPRPDAATITRPPVDAGAVPKHAPDALDLPFLESKPRR